MKFPKISRPVMIGGLVIGAGVVLFALLSRGGSSAGGTAVTPSGPSENLQLANLQSQTQLALAQMQTGAELQALQFRGELEAALATQALQGEIALRTIESQDTANTLAAQLAGMQAQLDSNLAIQQTQAQVQREEIQANREIQMATLQSNTAMFTQQVTAALEQTRIQNETIQFQTAAQSQIWANQQQLGALEAQYQRDVSLAQIESNTTLGLDQGATDRYMAGQQGRTQRRGQTLGFVGSIIGGALSLFSDVRIKEDIEQIGETPEGFPLYGYTVDGQYQVGHMAQEMAILAPEAVGFSGEFLTLDYGRIAA